MLIAMMMVLAAPPADDGAAELMATAASRLSVTRCEAGAAGCERAPDRARSPYRLQGYEPAREDRKARALADDGGQCGLVGAKMCTSRGKTIFRSDQDIGDTLSGSISGN